MMFTNPSGLVNPLLKTVTITTPPNSNPFATKPSTNNSTTSSNPFSNSASSPSPQGQAGKGFLSSTGGTSQQAMGQPQPAKTTGGLGQGSSTSGATPSFSMFNNANTSAGSDNTTSTAPINAAGTGAGNNLFMNSNQAGGLGAAKTDQQVASQPQSQVGALNNLFKKPNPMANTPVAQQAATTQPTNPLVGTGTGTGTGSSTSTSNPLMFNNQSSNAATSPTTPSFGVAGTTTPTTTTNKPAFDLFKKKDETAGGSTGAAGLNVSQNLSSVPEFQKKTGDLTQQNKPAVSQPSNPMFTNNANTTTTQNPLIGTTAATTTAPASSTTGGMAFPKMAETVVNPPAQTSTSNQPTGETQETRETLTQKLAHQFQMTNRTCGEYADLWRNTLTQCYQQIRTQCNIVKSYALDRKQNYNIIKNFNQLEPVISQNKKITNLMLDGIQNKQNQMMAILNGIKEEFGNDYNSRYIREHPITMHLRDCREIRKQINTEEEKQTGVQEEDASNQQLKNIFFNLDSVENQIRRLTHVMDHYFGKIVI